MSFAIELKDIAKSFPGVAALRGVSLAVAPGEVHALLGENGAGKSTLLKILAGVQRADSGAILIDGRLHPIHTPRDAQAAGIALIHQELQLVPELDVAQNMFLGRVLRHRGVFADRRRMRARARAALRRLGVDIDVRTKVKDLSVAQKQLVEIGRALLWDAKAIAMDEPTSALTPQEFEGLVKIIQDVSAQGVAIIYVSHKLGEVARLCTSGTVLRDGQVVGTVRPGEVPQSRLVQLMVGRDITPTHASVRAFGDEVLRAEGLVWRNMVRGVSLTARRGEILCIGGLVGAGRTELVRLLAGAAKPESGVISWKGKPVRFRSPREAIRAGIGLAPEDRKREAIIPIRPVLINVALPILGRLSVLGIINRRATYAVVGDLVRRMNLRPPSLDREIRLLSGGNQQKAVISRLLAADIDLMIFDEPTRGIDVGAKQEIYSLIETLAHAGKSIIVVSSELPEILRLADRVLVMRAGQIGAELRRDELTEEVILYHAIPEGHRH